MVINKDLKQVYRLEDTLGGRGGWSCVLLEPWTSGSRRSGRGLEAVAGGTVCCVAESAGALSHALPGSRQSEPSCV